MNRNTHTGFKRGSKVAIREQVRGVQCFDAKVYRTYGTPNWNTPNSNTYSISIDVVSKHTKGKAKIPITVVKVWANKIPLIRRESLS